MTSTPAADMAVLVWVMIAIALWHFTVLVPDRFWGGIIGAFMVAVAGGLIGGYLLPTPGLPADNPPGAGEAIFAAIGTVAALALSYAYGSRTRPTGSSSSSPPARRPPRAAP